MYKCEILKYVWKDSKKEKLHKAVQVDIDLNFVPSVDLEIVTDSWFTGKITRVVWSESDKLFTLQAEDELPSSDCDAQFLLSQLVKQGWKAIN